MTSIFARGFVCVAAALLIGIESPAWGQFSSPFPGSNSGPNSMPNMPGVPDRSDRDSDRVTFRGEVSGAQGANNLRVVLRAGYGPSASAELMPTGSFEFFNVPAGSYELQVVDIYGNVLHQELVTVAPGTPFVAVRLDVQEKVRVPKAGTVSLRRLQHKVPVKAVKELKEAEKLEKKGDNQAVLEHLEKAVAIDPECFECLNNLGARFLRAKQFDKAIEQFQKALKIDGNDVMVQSNAAMALLLSEKPVDAERAARRAVDIDGTSTKSRYLLALTLLAQDKYDQETLKNFQMASAEIPKAHLAAAQVFERMGKPDEARGELEQYVASHNATPELKQQAQAWMARLAANQQ